MKQEVMVTTVITHRNECIYWVRENGTCIHEHGHGLCANGESARRLGPNNDEDSESYCGRYDDMNTDNDYWYGIPSACPLPEVFSEDNSLSGFKGWVESSEGLRCMDISSLVEDDLLVNELEKRLMAAFRAGTENKPLTKDRHKKKTVGNFRSG